MKPRVIRNIGLFMVLALLLQWSGLGLISGSAFAADPPSTLQTSKPVFSDVPETDALYPYVRYLAGQGIVNGFPDGAFRPGESLTRAQVANIMVLAKKIPLVAGSQPTFKDVSPTHWAYSSIEAAARAGLLAGYPDGAFQPNRMITRAEAVTLLLSLSGGKLSANNIAIGDVNPGHWAYKSVVTAVEAGLVELSADKLFSPGAAFNRGELVQGLCALLVLGPDLRAAELTGKLTVTKGQVTIDSSPVSRETTIKAGMTVMTDAQGQAQITFDDGSGILIDSDTEISIVKAQGLHYIRTDGSPAVAVDKLEIKINKGRIFGALANPNEGSETSSLTRTVAGDKNGDWWLYPASWRERVTIQMPGGAAGIFGTFWSNLITPGSSGSAAVDGGGTPSDPGTPPAPGGGVTTVLTGHAEVTSGGQIVPLTGGQSSSLTPPSGGTPPAPPTPPAPMSPQQLQGWVDASGWAAQTAQQIQNNGPLTPPPIAPPPTGAPQQQPPTPPSVLPPPQQQPPVTPPTPPGSLVETITGALQQAAGNASPPAAPPAQQSSGSNSHSRDPVITFDVRGTSANGDDWIDVEFSDPMNTQTLTQALIRQGSVVTVFYCDDNNGANRHNFVLDNVTTNWIGDKHLRITFDEDTDNAVIPDGKFVGVTLAGTVKSASGYSVSGTAYSRTSIYFETSGPVLMNWTLNFATGVITITFDEKVDPATLDLSKISLVEGEDTSNSYPLTESTCTDTSPTKTISITLSSDACGFIYEFISDLLGNLSTDPPTLIQLAESCHIELAEGAVGDVHGNKSEADANTIWYLDSFTPPGTPSLLSWTLNMNAGDTGDIGDADDTGVITLTFDERVDASTLVFDKISVSISEESATLAGSVYEQASFTDTVILTFSGDAYDSLRKLGEGLGNSTITLEEGAVQNIVGHLSEAIAGLRLSSYIPKPDLS